MESPQQRQQRKDIREDRKAALGRDLLARQERYGRLLALKQTPFWKEDIEPFLDHEERATEKGSLWSPEKGIPTVDAVALGSAFNGGRNDEITRFRGFLIRCEHEGKAAMEKLRELEEAGQ